MQLKQFYPNLKSLWVSTWIHGPQTIKICFQVNKFAGTISTLFDSPQVYFILKGRYLYIGETQKLSVFRWSDHFRPLGSFSKALDGIDPDVLNDNSEVRFFLFQCTEFISRCKSSEFKRTTQYLEHILHIKTITHPVLGPKFRIISDTTRTAPTNCVLSDIDNMAQSILQKLVETL